MDIAFVHCIILDRSTTVFLIVLSTNMLATLLFFVGAINSYVHAYRVPI